MSSINLESCDELVQNNPNSQFLQYKRQFHQGYQQMKSGLRSKSPIDNEQAFNKINQERYDNSSQTFQINNNIGQSGTPQQEFHNSINQIIAKDFNSPIQSHKTFQDLHNLNDTYSFQSQIQKDQTYTTSHLFKDYSKISKKDLSSTEQSSNQYLNGSYQSNQKQIENQLPSQTAQQQTSKQLQILQIPPSDNYKLIPHTSNIYEIDLSNSQLTSFPLDICQMIQLTKVKLDSNAITKIPSEISKLVNLKQLSISDNKIFSIPSSFEGLQSLILLNISKNFLDPFPQEICKLKNLVILHIQNNYFISLPLELALLENLQEFSIEWFKYTFPSMNQIQSDYFTIQTLKNECKRLYLLRKSQQILQNQTLPNCLISQRLEENVQQLNEVQKNQFQINQGQFQKSQRGTDVMIDVDEYSNCYEGGEQISDNSKIKNLQNIQTQYATKLVNNQNQSIQNNISDLSFQQFLTLFSKDPISYLSKCDVRGRNIFHLSALNQEISIIKAANFCQLHPQSINQMDDDYQTPLSLALLEEKFLSAKILLFFGADPLLGGGKLGTCLHIAVTKMDIEIVNQILNKGGDANSRDFEGNTPLHLIFSIFRKDQRKAASIIELLIQKGADCNIKNFDNWSPLHLAVKRMQVEAIEWIASYEKYDQKFNWNIQGGNQQLSLLHLASKLGYTEIIQVIIEKVDPLLVSRCNQIARDLGQSNNLISKLLKKKEIDVFEKHFHLQKKQLSEEQSQNIFDDKRNKQFKHLKSTFLLENKSFPIEKYEQLIEEKLAASKQIQQKNNNLEYDQKYNLKNDSYDNKMFAKVPNLKENFALLRDYQGDSPLCQLDFSSDTFRQKSQDNTQRSKANSIQYQNQILVNELEIYCAQVFNLIKKNQTNIFLETKNKKTEPSQNSDRCSQLKSITEGQNASCELLDQEDIKNMWYGKKNKLQIKNSSVLASSKVLVNQDDSFEIIEDSEDNIPEEYTSSHAKKHQFNIQNYQTTNNQLWQLSETEKNLQSILKQSINALIDERINLTWKLQLLQLLSQHIQLQKPNGTDLEKIILLSKNNQPTNHASSTDSTTQRSRSVISSRDDEQSINQRVLFDYLPLYLQSVIRYNSEKNSNQLVAIKILDLISLIPNQNLLQFLENFYKQICNQNFQCSPSSSSSCSVNLIKSILDVYSFLQNQQRLKKKISPLANFAKKQQQNKIVNKKQEINNKNAQEQISLVPPIAYLPSQSTAQVRIPRMNFNQTSQNNSVSQIIKPNACYPIIQIDFNQKSQILSLKGDQQAQQAQSIINEDYKKYQKNINSIEQIQLLQTKKQNQFDLNQNQFEKDINKQSSNQSSLGLTSNKLENYQQQNQQLFNKTSASVSMHSQPASTGQSYQAINSIENNQNPSLLTPRDNSQSILKQQENNLQKNIYSQHNQSQNQETQNKFISRNLQEANCLYSTNSQQKKSLTPQKVKSTQRTSNVACASKNTQISIQITPKKFDHNYSYNQNLQTFSSTSSQSQQNTINLDKQQLNNKKDQNNFTSSIINRDSSNNKIIETNPCATPSSNYKTQSTSTERMSFSANSYNIQQKIQLNRIIQSKTQASQNNMVSIKKPEKLFETTLEKKKQASQTMRWAQDHSVHIQTHKNELNELLKLQSKNEHSQLFNKALSQTYSFQSQSFNTKQETTGNIQSKDISAVCSHLESQNCTDILYQQNNLNSKATLSQTLNSHQEGSPKQIQSIDSPKNRISNLQKQNSTNSKSQLQNKISRFVK